MKTKRLCLLLLASCLLPLTISAQSASSIIKHDKNFAAGSYGIYSDSYLPQQTPAPQGYEPFYISHYGRHGSRYVSDMKVYTQPYQILHKADSLGKLTAVGQMALREMRQNLTDAEGRWGDLTGIGKRQQRNIAHRMIENFPQIFSDGAFVDAHSTIVNRCVFSMGTAVLQLVKERPSLQVTMSNSYGDMWYMNHQNKELRDSIMGRRAGKAFTKFTHLNWNRKRLMSLLFNDSVYVRQHVDVRWTAYYLAKAALMQRNTHRYKEPNPLLELFTDEDLHLFWQIENAHSYIHSGFCKLNGAKMPYLQVYLLRQIIKEADSIINSSRHGASLRFGHETVLLPLVCLMGINGYDLQTDNLQELEAKGWWASLVYPMAGNLQIIFYRKNAEDRNPLIKVLLNEKEAVLPLPSDLAPYYRWSDFRNFYLQRVAEGESVLRSKR